MADSSTIARPYARALFDLANASESLKQWSEALNLAAAVLNDPGAKRALARPDLQQSQRIELVHAVVQGLGGGELWSSSEGRNLLALLVENDRLTAVPEIAAQFDALKTAAENRVKATLVSAVPVDKSVADQVAAALQKKLGRNVELSLEIDPKILGGAIIRAEDMVIDGSVRTRLQRLAESLVA